MLQYVNYNYDYVIFDFPSVAVAPDAQILFGEVDGIILISALDMVTKRQIRDAKHKVQPFADRYYGMIINRIDKDLYSKYIKGYNYYFVDKNGKQKLSGRANRRYQRTQKAAKKEGSQNEKTEE